METSKYWDSIISGIIIWYGANNTESDTSSTHSGVCTGATLTGGALEVKSKWGEKGFYVHPHNYCPYNSSRVTYYDY